MTGNDLALTTTMVLHSCHFHDGMLQVLLKVQADRVTNACKVSLLEATCTASDGALLAKLQRTHESEDQFHRRQVQKPSLASSLLAEVAPQKLLMTLYACFQKLCYENEMAIF